MALEVSDSMCFYWRQTALKSDTLYTVETQKFEQLTGINKSLVVALDDEKRKKQKMCIGVGVGGTLLGILLGVLLGK